MGPEENDRLMKTLFEEREKAVQERKHAKQRMDAAQAALRAAIKRAKAAVKEQEDIVSSLKKGLKISERLADPTLNKASLIGSAKVQKKASEQEQAESRNERAARLDAAARSLQDSRNSLREREAQLFAMRRSTFAGDMQAAQFMLDADKAIRAAETSVGARVKAALAACEDGEKMAEVEDEELSEAAALRDDVANGLRELHELTAAEHTRAAEAMAGETGASGGAAADDGGNATAASGAVLSTEEEKEKRLALTLASFARAVSRANGIRARDCGAADKLQELVSQLGVRIGAARDEIPELSSDLDKDIELSLRKGLANLEHQRVAIEEAEGEMRRKCADASSRAQRAKDEADAARAVQDAATGVGGGETGETGAATGGDGGGGAGADADAATGSAAVR